MVLWIGVDDTDSLRGMCTTFLATELVRELTTDHDLIGFPRLVRLNPNIPWKTRGNGAIALAVGDGRGEPFPIGQFGREPVLAFPRGNGLADPRRILERLSAIVERWSELDVPGTNPGLVVLREKPPPSLYWRAVRSIVDRRRVDAIVRRVGLSRTWNTGRGVIGATAACAWRPRDRTWEVLAYRTRERWGTPRTISEDSVIEMDRSFLRTFNNYDFENRHVAIAPSSPCPVLFGIRGDRHAQLVPALRVIRGETPERWLVFETNQGTDDHVLPGPAMDSLQAGTFEGYVTESPRTLPGGHVVFALDGRMVTAYEPSKQFRQTVRALREGDRVVVIGSVRPSPRTINLEKLRVVSLTRPRVKVANPLCRHCGSRMKSMGRSGYFRCRRCGAIAPRQAASFARMERDLAPGWYEPPVGSRRHLSKPLTRGWPKSRASTVR